MKIMKLNDDYAVNFSCSSTLICKINSLKLYYLTQFSFSVHILNILMQNKAKPNYCFLFTDFKQRNSSVSPVNGVLHNQHLTFVPSPLLPLEIKRGQVRGLQKLKCRFWLCNWRDNYTLTYCSILKVTA